MSGPRCRVSVAHTNKPRCKRRRSTFSLRTLLLVTLFVGAVPGWLGSKIMRARAQEQVIVELVNQANIIYENQGSNAPAGPAWLRRMLGDHYFLRVREVDLHERQAADAALKHVARLSEL